MSSQRTAGLALLVNTTSIETNMAKPLSSSGRSSGDTTAESLSSSDGASKRKRLNTVNDGGGSDVEDTHNFFGDDGDVYGDQEDDEEEEEVLVDIGNGSRVDVSKEGVSEGDSKVDPSQLDWQGRIDLVRKSMLSGLLF